MVKLNNIIINDIRLLNQVKKEFNGNVDVAVKSKNGYSYLINISISLKLREEMNIGKQLLKDIITKAIQYYDKDDSYHRKLW